MPWVKDYYGILGCSPTADPVVIRAAWKALLSKYHPDVDWSEEAARKLALINEAWDVLGSRDTRASYDASLRAPGALGHRTRESAPPRPALTDGFHRHTIRAPRRRWRRSGPAAMIGGATLGTFATAAALTMFYTPQGARELVDTAWAARRTAAEAGSPTLDIRRMTNLRADLEQQDGAGAEAAARMMRLEASAGRCQMVAGQDATADARAVCPSLGLVAQCANGRGSCRARP